MRTVVKAVFRSFSASAATNVANLESQLISDIAHPLKRKEFSIVDNHSFSASSNCRDMSRSFEMKLKTESLSPIYKLTAYEESCFEELQDKECDYYPNISIRGDRSILNVDLKSNNNDQNVSSKHIMMSLKNIRFVNSIVFSQNCDVLLTTANYVQRLLHTKAVKKDLIQFICAAMYDLALEQKVGKALSKDKVTLLLSLTNIPINHIEDFSRMKSLLLGQLNNDLESMAITDYLQILLKINPNTDSDNLPESHSQLMDLACILASSCELTHFTLATQAISLVNVAARHVSFDMAFANQFSHIIARFPMIFTSPVRLHQFAKLDNVCEETIKQCSECIVRFLAKYYEFSVVDGLRKSLGKRDVSGEGVVQLGTVIEEDEEAGQIGNTKEERRAAVLKNPVTFDINELIEKLHKVRLALNTQINGKQKQRQKRIKKKLSRQLKKCDRSKLDQVCLRSLLVDDDDSAISSCSDLTSPSNSPLSS